LLLSEDLATGLRINSGKIEKPSLSGLGIEINQDIRFAVTEN
jgi:hypothetical protein